MKKSFLILLGLSVCGSIFAQIKTTTSKKCYLLYNYDGKEFTESKKLKEGSSIIVYKESEDLASFYEVEYKNIKGYLKENCIAVNADMQILLSEKAARLKAEKAELDSLENAKYERLQRERFGKWYSFVKRKELVIGMPEHCIPACLGTPDAINRSEYSFGKRAQYVYKNMYIYTTDGIIDAIQRMSR